VNSKGQFSIIAALLVAVVLIGTVITTYATLRYSTNQDQPQVLSAIDETNLALEKVLGFTVGYYGSILQVTGDTSYAKDLTTNYLNSSLNNIADIQPEWGASFSLVSLDLSTNWFTNNSYSAGQAVVAYDLVGLGIYGMSYQASCRLDVQVSTLLSSSQVCLNVFTDGDEPLVNLGEQNFQFYRYQYSNLTWDFAAPSGEVTAFANGTYLIDIPPGIDSSSYVVQVTDTRGLMVAAASFSRITSTLMWNTTTSIQGEDYVDSSTVNVGAQSNFTAQQYGPDGVYDTLTEGVSGSVIQNYYPSNFNLIGSTTLASGTIANLQSDNGQYMQFHSYASAYTSPSTFGYTDIGGYSEDTKNYIRGSLFSPSSTGQARSISAYLDLTATPQTFGHTSIESSTASIANTIRGSLFAPSYDGVATSISAYLDGGSMTFGNTNQEYYYSSGYLENTIRGSSFTCTENGTIQSITAYIQCTSSAKNMKAAIYNEGTHTKVAETEENSIPPGTAWVTFNFPTPPSVTEGNSYVLVVWSDSGYGYAYLYYSYYGSWNQGHSQSRTYDGWPSSASFSHDNYRYSIYCTYTPTPRTVKAAIYSEAHTLIASTEEKTASSYGWVTFDFTNPPTLAAGTNYILVARSDSANGDINLRYHNGGYNQGHSLSQTYGAWPSPAGFAHDNREYSIYCTYQPSAKVKAAIYSAFHSLIASTEEKTVSADGWVTFNFTNPPTVTAGTNYILVVWSENIAGDVLIYYHGGGYNQGHYLSRTYDGNYPSSANFYHENREYSIYCTYSSASEYTCEIEFTGTSDTQDWSQLVWAIDSSSTVEGVNASFELWNYQAGRYALIGEDGYNSATIGTSDVTISQIITSSPSNFRDGAGNWKLKFKAVKSTSTQFDMKIDLVRYSPEFPNYALDIEEQWTNVNYEYPRQDLCIRTGTLGPENLIVDVHTGSSWVTVINSLLANQWNNVSVAQYIDSPTFAIRFRDGSSSSDSTSDSWNIDAVLLSPQPDIDVLLSQMGHTIVIELLQNGTMRWLGQNLQLTTQEKPIPPIPVKAIHVSQTINGVNQEVPFQIEDWASEYRIPLGLTNNATVFSNRQMIVFLINVTVSKVTVWWNGSDTATQTPLAYTNCYFNDNSISGTLDNGRLTVQFASSGFQVTSTLGNVTSIAELMRINMEEDTTEPELAYVIVNGTVRDIVQGEAEWGKDGSGIGGADGCPNVYANIVLSLPAQATYYTYQLRLMFINSTQPRTITDLCPIKLTTSIDQLQTENGTVNGIPIVSNGTSSFYNFTSGTWTAHHWSQFISGSQGAGIMFTNASNQQLYVFDSIAGSSTGALRVNNSTRTIELLPVALSQTLFTYALDVTWHGAVATFDSSATPVYTLQGTAPTGLWLLVEHQPTITVASES
jgi:hypothetical protein